MVATMESELTTADRPAGIIRKIVDHPSAVLLAVQLVGVLLYPFMEQTSVGRGVFEVFGGMVLALAIWSVRKLPGPTWIAVILAIAASALSIIDAFSSSPVLQVLSAVCHARVSGLLSTTSTLGTSSRRPRAARRNRFSPSGVNGLPPG